MATRTFIGGASEIAQVDRATPGGTIEANDKFKITLTDESGATGTVSAAAGGTTVAAVTAAVAAAVAASTDPRFQKITASDQTAYTKFTAKTPGVPFYMSVTTTESDDSAADAQTFTHATDTPNQGPTDLNCPGNYAEGIAPVATDNIIIASGTIEYGVRQAAVFTGGFTIAPGCGSTIGGPGTPLSITPSSFTTYGTGKAYIDLNGATISPRILSTGPGGLLDPGLSIIGSAISVMRIEGGTVGIALRAGETATIATVELAGGFCATGVGAGITNWRNVGGTGEMNAAGTVTSIVADEGKLTTTGAFAVTTLTNNGATVIPNSSGTITTLNQNDGRTDLTQSRTPRTITSTTYAGGIIEVDSAVVTMTNKIAPSGHVKLTAVAA